MKKILLLLASCAILFSSCKDTSTEVQDQDQDLDESVLEVTFKGEITSDTRVTDNLFDSNNEIYVTAFDGESIFADKVSYVYDGAIFSSTTPITYDSESQNLSFITAYPAVDNLAKSFTFKVLEDQNSGDNYEMSDLLIATKDAAYDLCPTLTFNYILSNFAINISDDAFKGGVLTVYAIGEAIIDIENQTCTAVTGASSMAITAATDGTTYKAILSPQVINEGDMIATYKLNGITYTWYADDNMTIEPGFNYIFSWDVENIYVELLSTINNWDNGGEFDINWSVKSK